MRSLKKILAISFIALAMAMVLTACNTGGTSSSSIASGSSDSSDSSSSSPLGDIGDSMTFRTYTGTDASAETIIVKAKILDDTDAVMFDGEAQIKKVLNPTVYEVTEAAAFFVPFTFENDNYTSFGDIAPTDTLAWYLYVNGEKSDKLPKDVPVKAGDLIEWKLSPKA